MAYPSTRVRLSRQIKHVGLRREWAAAKVEHRQDITVPVFSPIAWEIREGEWADIPTHRKIEIYSHHRGFTIETRFKVARHERRRKARKFKRQMQQMDYSFE